MTEIIFLIFGIIGLVIGAELVTRGALNIGEHYKISHVILGLTILAFGSDLPELFINIQGAFDRLNGIETSGIIVGDAIGSNFGQIGLILGIIGLFGVLKLTRRQMLRDGLTLLGATILLFLVSLNGDISRIEGLILIIIYILYLAALYREENFKEKVVLPPRLHILWAGLSLIGGFALLYFASNLALDNAVALSDKFNISQSIIGILILGLGTSLPEFAISLSAIRKKAHGIAIGNLIGSNIFDTLIPIGAAAVISELQISKEIIFFDIPSLFVLTILVLILFMYKKKLQKKESALLIIVFLLYAVLKITFFQSL
ncbi:calcium/sodium antiporter [Patescibacteria group bacterium]